MNLNAIQIKDACKGEFLVEPIDTTVFATCIKIDSRKVECGDLFIAFDGENVDGHNFIDSAIDNKASIIICEKNLDDEVINKAKDAEVSIIKVESSQQAITDISKYWRTNLIGKVIGITGSVGKTTVKKLVYDCLSTKFQTTANDGNYNNEIGLPITLCKANFNDDFVVTEMGMSQIGEIKSLCDIAQPSWGLITNIGQAHMEFLGSQENIAIAKAELADAIPDNIGTMFLPTEDAYTNFIIKHSKLKEREVEIVYFGASELKNEIEEDQVWFEELNIDANGKSNFKICIKGFGNSEVVKEDCKLNLAGKFNVSNACGAIAIALKAGVDLKQIIEVLNNTVPEHGRFEVIKSKAGFNIINDAYNASPQSMIASVDVLSNMNVEAKKICILGDMFELGKIEKSGHEEVGTFVASKDIDYLICIGQLSKLIYDAAIKAGMNEENVLHFENTKDAKDKILEICKDKDVVLLKASNSMKFQDFAKELAG